MEVKLEKRYPMDASPAQVWAVLRDVRAVAGCMPGAAINEQVDDNHFKGSVKVKVGPALAAFAGDIEVLALDEPAQRLQLLGKGADKSGSTASMNLTAQVEAGDLPGQCVLVGDAVVIVNGKFAQFGGRMMVQVSDMILGQFADNFRLAAAAVPAPAPAPATTAAPALAEATTPPTTDTAPASPAPAAKPPAATPQALPPARAHTELNALAIVWMLVKNWFGGLFGRKTT